MKPTRGSSLPKQKEIYQLMTRIKEVKTLRHIHLIEYYLVIKRNEVLKHITTQMNFGNFM